MSADYAEAPFRARSPMEAVYAQQAAAAQSATLGAPQPIRERIAEVLKLSTDLADRASSVADNMFGSRPESASMATANGIVGGCVARDIDAVLGALRRLDQHISRLASGI